jgi:glycosyltransferase involved in cell wall biosynthesis
MGDKTKERIAILHYTAPPVIGGVENTIQVHARMLASAGYDLTVIAGRGKSFDPRVEVHILPELDSRHTRTLEVGKTLSLGTVSPEFDLLKGEILNRLRPLLNQCEIVIVHNAITLHKNLALTAALHQLSQEKKSHYIAWCHDFAWLDELYSPELHPGMPWDLLRIHWPGLKYVVVSHHRRAMIADLLQIPESTVSVITPGVDVYEFLGLSPLVINLIEKLDLLRAEPLMILPARVTRRKNIEFAIHVTAHLQPLFPRPTLIVTGPPGPHNPKNLTYLRALNNLKAELGLNDRVFFLYEQGELGESLELPYSAVAELYRVADLLLFPSQREGFGIPPLEAGLARIPVFAASIPSAHESLGDHATFFDPNGDPQTAAALIQQRLAASATYNLRRQTINRFSWQSILHQQIIPLLEEVSAA